LAVRGDLRSRGKAQAAFRRGVAKARRKTGGNRGDLRSRGKAEAAYQRRDARDAEEAEREEMGEKQEQRGGERGGSRDNELLTLRIAARLRIFEKAH
jgi:hypothetical protein